MLNLEKPANENLNQNAQELLGMVDLINQMNANFAEMFRTQETQAEAK